MLVVAIVSIVARSSSSIGSASWHRKRSSSVGERAGCVSAILGKVKPSVREGRRGAIGRIKRVGRTIVAMSGCRRRCWRKDTALVVMLSVES